MHLIHKLFTTIIICTFLISGCQPAGQSAQLTLEANNSATQIAPAYEATLKSNRPNYAPGELVDYTAQIGDTLPALAAHFNTTELEIRENNPILPQDVTTLPTGLPLKIPIYYEALWGSQYQIARRSPSAQRA